MQGGETLAGVQRNAPEPHALEVESQWCLQACLGHSPPKGGSSPSAGFTPTEADRAGSTHPASAWILVLPASTLFPAPEAEILEARGRGSRIPWPLGLPAWESPGLPYKSGRCSLPQEPQPLSGSVCQSVQSCCWSSYPCLPGRLLEVCSQRVPLRQMRGGRPISRLPATVTEEALTVSDRAICRLGSSSTHPGKFIYSWAELTSEDLSNHGCPNYLCRKTWGTAPTEWGSLANVLKEEASLLPSPKTRCRSQSIRAVGCHHVGCLP